MYTFGPRNFEGLESLLSPGDIHCGWEVIRSQVSRDDVAPVCAVPERPPSGKQVHTVTHFEAVRGSVEVHDKKTGRITFLAIRRVAVRRQRLPTIREPHRW